MSKPESLMIDHEKYIRADAGLDAPYQIAVLDRGFVYIGYVKWNDDVLTITNAKCIRRWGTTKGLGELVNGPRPETILDTVGTIHVPEHALIHLIDVVESAWTARGEK